MIENYVSALAHYWKLAVGFDIPEADLVLWDLFRGVAREKSVSKKYVADWSVGPVLNFYKSVYW